MTLDALKEDLTKQLREAFYGMSVPLDENTYCHLISQVADINLGELGELIADEHQFFRLQVQSWHAKGTTVEELIRAKLVALLDEHAADVMEVLKYESGAGAY